MLKRRQINVRDIRPEVDMLYSRFNSSAVNIPARMSSLPAPATIR